MTIRQCVAYHNDLRGTLTFDLKERQKCYGPDKKILFKKQLFDLEVKGQGPTKVVTVCDTPPNGHAPKHQINTI
jgi:hypothetical protein